MADAATTLALFNLRTALNRVKHGGYGAYNPRTDKVVVHADDLDAVLAAVQAQQSRKPDASAQDSEDTVKRVREHLRGEADYCERGLLRDLLRAYEAKGAVS